MMWTLGTPHSPLKTIQMCILAGENLNAEPTTGHTTTVGIKYTDLDVHYEDDESDEGESELMDISEI